MNPVIIPYFLSFSAFAGVINTNTWTMATYGPEYVYSVTLNFTRSIDKELEAVVAINTTATLRCQPRNLTLLHCSLENVSRTFFDSNKPNTMFQRNHVSSSQLFDIKFNENGVEKLIVSQSADSPYRSVSDSHFAFIRTIANEFNIGTLLTSDASMNFVANENSTYGECETSFNISKTPCETFATRQTPSDGRDVQFYTVLTDTLGDSILLRKRRNMKKCRRNQGEIRSSSFGKELKMIVTSSSSGMHVCQKSFESYTLTEGKALILNTLETSVFKEFVKIRLDNIGEAKSEAAAIVDAVEASIFLHEDIDNNYVED